MKRSLSVMTAVLLGLFASAAENDLEKAIELYERGLYVGAMDILQNMPEAGSDPMVDGYFTLSAIRQKTAGYRTAANAYLSRYASSSLCDDILLLKGFYLFEDGDYVAAAKILNGLDINKISSEQKAGFVFKRGYCKYKREQLPDSFTDFVAVDAMPLNDYSAPARYLLGYMRYNEAAFDEALYWFEKAAGDERFASLCNYYTVICHFEKADYQYVLDKGVAMYEDETVPGDRRAHLARVISESYLVAGDKDNARRYFSVSDDGSARTRADYFYAGSLMYTTGDWKQAIENYRNVVSVSDSLSQIAWYQMAFSYINTKNKVAALDAFKQATALKYDARMLEDSHFNYAKLAFDLNGDTSVFSDYTKTYADKVRGEKIYSYMALAALQDRDYQSAIDNYDKIDVLEGQEKNNYVHANYLRGAELLDNGSYRNAMQCFKAVTYYTPKNDRVNQLARYSLAEAYYRNGQFVDAATQFAELYNTSALYGMEEGNLLPYNLAYSLLKQQRFDEAAKWFGTYVSDGGYTYAKDAMIRKADCAFMTKDFATASKAYKDEMDRFYDVNDIYPYYQYALSQGYMANTKGVKKARQTEYMKIKLSTLENVLKADPGVAYYPEAMFELATTQMSLKKDAAALETYEKLVQAVPASVYAAKALLEAGTIKRNRGDIDGALQAYKTVVEKMQASGLGDDALMAVESIYQSQNRPAEYIAYIESIGQGETKTEEDRQNMIFNAAEQIFYSDNYPRALAAFQEFKQNYPQSAKVVAADFYIAECYRFTGDKEQASDAYGRVIAAGTGDFYENALRQHADLNLSLDNFAVAYASYKILVEKSSQPAMLTIARVGMMRSAFKAKDYENAIADATVVAADASADAAVVREANMTRARALLSVSRRDEAMKVLETLSLEPATAEGAEAAYMLIQDAYDKADYAKVVERVHAFQESGTGRVYWLAKAFILLGDSYAEQGNMKQAKATFQSIADNYSANDEIPGEVKVRLDKLNENN